MLRCPNETYFGSSLRNLVQNGNLVSSRKDKFLIGFGLDLQLEFLLTLPLYQSLMSIYKLNKMFSISKLVPLLFKCNLLRLQLYLGFISSLSMNSMFLLLHASLKTLLIFHRHFNYRFGAQFQKSSPYYHPFYIGKLILVLYQQSFYELFHRYRYSKAKNKYLKCYDPKQQSKHIICLDANNLYGYEISKFLPPSGSKWIEPKDFDLNKYTSNSSKGRVLEVHLEYRKELRELQNDYPLAPEKTEIKSEMLSD